MIISLKFKEDVAVIGIDDGYKNVINHLVLDELESAWDSAENKAKAILLKGREGIFCAGYDISVMTGVDPAASAELGRRGGRLAGRIYGSRVPVVGLAQGHAFTIGPVWLAGCDVRIGEDGPYKYGMTEVALSVPLTGWALEAMRSRLNPRSHVDALMHSKVYDPQGALDAGFIDQLVPKGQGFDLAMATVKKLAALPTASYQKTKQALRQPVLDLMGI